MNSVSMVQSARSTMVSRIAGQPVQETSANFAVVPAKATGYEQMRSATSLQKADYPKVLGSFYKREIDLYNRICSTLESIILKDEQFYKDTMNHAKELLTYGFDEDAKFFLNYADQVKLGVEGGKKRLFEHSKMASYIEDIEKRLKALTQR